MHIEIIQLEKSEKEMLATVDAAIFMKYWDKAFKKVQEMVEMDGFRKGNVPENMVLAKYGDMIVLEEMANFALRDVYREAIEKHKLMPIGEPKVTIKKIAKDNPLELSLIVAVLPEVTLPSYKTLAKEEIKTEDSEPSEKEVEEVLKELQKGKLAASGTSDAHEGHDHEGHDHEGHEHHDHDTKIVAEGAEAKELPPLDDAFAQSFGDTFKTLDELKSKVKENLSFEKKQKLSEKNRQAVMERLIQETKVDVPDLLINDELTRMLSQMKADITRFGGTWEEYLTHSKKTEEDITKDWGDDARKRVVSQLLLAKIAEIETLVATEDEIEVELVRLLAQVQDADPERAKDYLRQALTNEKVLRFLLDEKVEITA